MNRVFVCHRPHDRQSVSNPSDLRQPLPDLQPRQRRVDRLHFSLNLSRCQRFGIERLMLRRRTKQKHKNTRLRSTPRTAGRCDHVLRTSEPETERTDPADLQQVTSRDTTADTLRASQNPQHGNSSQFPELSHEPPLMASASASDFPQS